MQELQQIFQRNNVSDAAIGGSSVADPVELANARLNYGYPVEQITPQDIDISILGRNIPPNLEQELRQFSERIGLQIHVFPDVSLLQSVDNYIQEGLPALIFNYEDVLYFDALPSYYTIDEFGTVGAGVRKSPLLKGNYQITQ